MTGIPANVNQVNITVEFYKLPNGQQIWVTSRPDFSLTMTVATSGSNDTGWLPMTNPMPGDKWKCVFRGNYIEPGMMPKTVKIPVKESSEFTPP